MISRTGSEPGLGNFIPAVSLSLDHPGKSVVLTKLWGLRLRVQKVEVQ